ncbi:MAG TPA: amidohydrolase family protein [Bryobacteraceae bacterium]|nr:amidohydrolase family protein [Bryobacteraceae bacterium]
MRVDSHQHFWRYDPVRDGWITGEMNPLKRDYLPEDLRPHMQANGIDGTVTVQVDQSEAETKFLIDLASRHDFIRGVVGWVDLRDPEVNRRLEYFSQFPVLRGFRHIAQSEPDDRFLAHEDFVRGVGALRQFGFTYDILIYPKHLPAACELVEKLPDQAFVLDHIAKPLVKVREIEGWAAGIRRMAQNPRVFCKLSGLITEADWKNWRASDFTPYLDIVFDAFGADRLMFGSDWPVCLLAGGYMQVVEIIRTYLKDRPAVGMEKIFGGNAVHFYGLKANAHGSGS